VVVSKTLFDDFGMTLLEMAGRMPALTDLVIDHDGAVQEKLTVATEEDPDADLSDIGLPHCGQLKDLHSDSLTRLSMSMLGGWPEGNTLRLVGLPALRTCQLIGQPDVPMKVCIDAASFEGAPQLQSLRLYFDAALQLQRGSFQQLNALTSLTVVGCGLRSVPAEVASLSATLCVLDLSCNDQLQIDAAAVATVLCCTRLQTLGLYKPEVSRWHHRLPSAWQRIEQHIQREGYAPAQYSPESLMHRGLLHLADAFRAQHGRGLNAVVTEEQCNKYLT